jgi:hypothetical protein
MRRCLSPAPLCLVAALLLPLLFSAQGLCGPNNPPPAPHESIAPVAPQAREALLGGYARELRRLLDAGTLPIIDVEHHWGGNIELGRLIALMDRWGVALTWLGVNERNGSASSVRQCASHPARLVPTTIHGDGPRWHGQDASLMDELEKDARSGAFFAMGEFEARHYVSSTNSRDVHLPMDAAMFQRALAVAEQTGMPMLVHHEAEDALLPEMERALDAHPRAKVVWCHVGRNRDRAKWRILPTPDGVRDMLRRHPNLYFDLNQSPAGSRFRGNNEVDSVLFDSDATRGGNQPDAKLNEGWRALLEEFSDRFVIGSDINTGRFDNYGRVFEMLRRQVLNRLSRQAAERIAFRNAWLLMSGTPWPD